MEVRAHAELRSSLERQLKLSCPHLDESTIQNLDEGRMQASGGTTNVVYLCVEIVWQSTMQSVYSLVY